MEELLREVLSEIASAPVRFGVEVAQSLILLALVVWFGRRLVRRRLDDRKARITSQLAEAETADRDCARIRAEAAAIAAGMHQQARDVIRAASEQARKEREAMVARIEAEAQQMVGQAREAVASDKNRTIRQASDRLIRLTADTARRYLDEVLTESDRRTLIQKAMLESLAELEGRAPPRDAGVA
jgi:F0F1-type ATP synthase membrane subunit b/b'